QLQKVLTIDAEVLLGMLSLRVVEEIESLEPHGIGNPRPLLLASRVKVVGAPRVVGERKNHVQFRVAQGGAILKAVGWSMAERALEVGTGSGYQTAVLSTLAAEVFTVERLATLSLRARSLLDGLGRTNIHYRIGDGSLGWPEAAPFDRILVTAGAPAFPAAL